MGQRCSFLLQETSNAQIQTDEVNDESEVIWEQQVEALKIQLYNERNQRQNNENDLTKTLESEISDLKIRNSELKERNEAFHDKILEMESELGDYEKKDEMWKKERNDVLLEIQRLKEEAEKFIEILSSSNE